MSCINSDSKQKEMRCDICGSPCIDYFQIRIPCEEWEDITGVPDWAKRTKDLSLTICLDCWVLLGQDNNL